MLSKSIPPTSQFALIIGLFITLASALITGTMIHVVQPELPLLYTQAQPVSTLVKNEWLMIIPALCLLLELLNLTMVAWFKSLSNLLLGVFSWVLVTSQVLLLLALIRILWIIL